jgi:hypothetical protein
MTRKYSAASHPSMRLNVACTDQRLRSQQCHRREISPTRKRIICDLFDYPHSTMEAERLNLIESTLADLARRADELRGYL